jgi:peptidoglycan-N-acetylglucosamine deacetylase
MFLHKTNILIQWIFSAFQWKVATQHKEIYLTFDDGPVPVQTEFVLDTLAKHACKATFFVIGDNVLKNKEIFGRILESEHSFGTHTMNHKNGWKTDFEEYIENYQQCNQVVPPTSLFRPPYGRLSIKQANYIKKRHKIVMWDVLSGDYSAELAPELILEKCIKYTEPGSIVLFHDSIKAWSNLQYVLPRYIEHFKEKGFVFKALPM